MRRLAAILLCFALWPAHAQTGAGHRDHGGRLMPPPERRMGFEERQKLREQVRSGQMTREEARQQWRDRRGLEPVRSPEERQQLRRDVMEANRDLPRR